MRFTDPSRVVKIINTDKSKTCRIYHSMFVACYQSLKSMGVGSFNNGDGISNRKSERISTKKVPDACFNELLLRLMHEVGDEKTDTASLEKDQCISTCYLAI